MKTKVYIKAAAIKPPSGVTHIGRTYDEIIGRIGYYCEQGLLTWRDRGFITSAGKFVSQFQAAEIAFKSGQIKEVKFSIEPEDLL